MRTSHMGWLSAALAGIVALLLMGAGASAGEPQATTAPSGPVVVMDTVKGPIEFETYPEDAPKTIEHVLRLIERRFYNGLRVHRVVKGQLIQFGDRKTRDMTKRQWWGRAGDDGSGRTIGAAEFSKRRTHVAGAVSMAHAGNAADADSQIFITMGPQPAYDGKYVVIGRVISGLDVVSKLEEADMIKRVSVKEGTMK